MGKYKKWLSFYYSVFSCFVFCLTTLTPRLRENEKKWPPTAWYKIKQFSANNYFWRDYNFYISSIHSYTVIMF